MILTRAPMRISFVGGGTDLASFYLKYPGRVISATVDKYVYVTVNRPPLMKEITARYAISEQVDSPEKLKNDRIREALLYFGIRDHIDVGSFSDVPVKTGLGSSSSFSVALMRALMIYKGKTANRSEIAELASHLEIDLVKEPIGKQDQYAAATGGLNVFQFNPDNSVDIVPLYLDYKLQSTFESHIQIFYTGITRLASSVLKEQRDNTDKKLDTLKQMSDLVLEFQKELLDGNFKALGALLHKNWLLKKTLASGVSNPIIDDMYTSGMDAGAWGGKILGAGGGGCVMFITPIEKKAAVQKAMWEAAKRNNLQDFSELPIRLVKSGVEVLMNHDNGRRAAIIT